MNKYHCAKQIQQLFESGSFLFQTSTYINDIDSYGTYKMLKTEFIELQNNDELTKNNMEILEPEISIDEVNSMDRENQLEIDNKSDQNSEVSQESEEDKKCDRIKNSRNPGKTPINYNESSDEEGKSRKVGKISINYNESSYEEDMIEKTNKKQSSAIRNSKTLSETVKCKYCGLSIPEKDLEKHTKLHKICDICGKLYKKRDIHMAKHIGAKIHKCTQCTTGFSTKCLLRAHIKGVHTTERPYTCDTCGKSYKTKEAVIQHSHSHKEGRFKCEECGKIFILKAAYQAHIKQVHLGERLSICSTCGKSFSTPYGLKLHTRMHTGVKPYKCDICDKAFSRTYNLNVHRRMHTGEKPYQCKYCDKYFGDLSTRKNHERLHTKEYTHPCHLCGKPHMNKAALIKHIENKHKNMKPHKCNQCERSFSDVPALRKHEKTHAEDYPYKCLVCEKALNCKAAYEKHMRIRHGESKQTLSEQNNYDIQAESL